VIDDGRWLTLLAAAGFAGFRAVYDPQKGSPAVDYPFLPLATIESFVPRMVAGGVSEVARSPRGFLTAYREAGGKPEQLDDFWWRRRSGFLARHLAQVEKHGEALFDARGRPTRRHLALIAWAYSPVAEKLAGSRGVVRRARPAPPVLPVFDQPDYQFYVLHRADPDRRLGHRGALSDSFKDRELDWRYGDGIESGWEDSRDARDRLREAREETPGLWYAPSRRTLEIYNFDPKDDQNWKRTGSAGVVRKGQEPKPPGPLYVKGERVRVETGTARGWSGVIEDVATSERIDPSVPRGELSPFAYYVSEKGMGGYWVYEKALRSLQGDSDG
jgi:hypothetical protein